MNSTRFGILAAQDAPLDVLVERWRRVEALGFDHLWVADHSHDYRALGADWFDGWTVLAAMAQVTSRVRIGTLVSNPILRPPALLAREALAVDHLSNGRLEVGIGAGVAAFDHATMGVDYWPPAERVARLAEYVAVVDGLLRSADGGFRFEGRYHRTDSAPMNPPPVQRPRPPITVGGQSPTVLRVAADHADCWNTHGPFGWTADDILRKTREQNRRLDDLCAERGRDPRNLRRSLLLFETLDAWTSADALERIVPPFRQAGIGEFVLFWPGDDRLRDLQRVAIDVLPSLRDL